MRSKGIKMQEGQMTLFDLPDLTEKQIDYAVEVAKHLIAHCDNWDYDWVKQLSRNKSHKTFMKLFCRISRTYFVPVGTELYDVEFSKEGPVTIKRCGRDYNKREADKVIDIKDILNLLPGELVEEP